MTTGDSKHIEEIINHLKRVENDYHIDLTSEMEWLRGLDKEEPVSKELEDFAKRESELFAEREYEVDSYDRGFLSKGFYWGVKAGAKWQEFRNYMKRK